MALGGTAEQIVQWPPKSGGGGAAVNSGWNSRHERSIFVTMCRSAHYNATRGAGTGVLSGRETRARGDLHYTAKSDFIAFGVCFRRRKLQARARPLRPKAESIAQKISFQINYIIYI